MAAFADMVLADGQATPVNHTFKARRIEGTLAKWQDISGGIAVGFPSLTVSSREPLKNSPNFRVNAKVVVPVLETISGNNYAGVTAAPQKAYDVVCDMSFIMPDRSTQAVRKDVLAYVKNLLANATIAAIITDLDFVA